MTRLYYYGYHCCLHFPLLTLVRNDFSLGPRLFAVLGETLKSLSVKWSWILKPVKVGR